MTLSNSLSIARSGLAALASQTAAVARNTANTNDLLASRKTVNVVTVPGAGVRVMSITRASDSALLTHMVSTYSAAGRQNSIVEGLDRLDLTVNDPELDVSPAAMIARLNNALQIYSEGPQDLARANAAVNAASDLVNSLHAATDTVQYVREKADADIASAVDGLNSLLAQFEAVNTAIVKGTRSGSDVTDYLDQRDRLLLAMSNEIGVRTITRGDNDMVVFTDGGVTLFEGKARTVTFEPTLTMTPTSVGNHVFVDGVQVTGATGGMASGTGRLSGLTAVRDEIAVDYQTQLDEIARGLIEIFAESDQSAIPALPDAPGLFTWSGAPAIPTSGLAITGLAGSIRVHASVDPMQGGDANLLRNGGIAGAAYIYNTENASGFSDRLHELVGKMTSQRSFDPDSQLNTTATIYGFSASSVGWLQELRKTASSEAEYRTTMFERSAESLSKATGVSLEEEMTLMLELERSYQATSRLISTIDEMYRSLLAVAG